MKIYNQAKLPLDIENANITFNWDNDCTHVVYDGEFNELLRQWTPDCQSGSFISSKNYLKDFDLKGNIPIREGQLVLSFRDENVTDVSDKIRHHLEGIHLDKTFGDMQRYITLIGTELVQNALIYGRIRNIHSEVILTLGVLDDQVQINVIDNYGALELAQILSKLKRCVIDATYEQKREGAGLGLYMVTRACDKMIITVNPSIQTQVCCIINRYQRLKEYKLKNISVYYIKEEAR